MFSSLLQGGEMNAGEGVARSNRHLLKFPMCEGTVRWKRIGEDVIGAKTLAFNSGRIEQKYYNRRVGIKTINMHSSPIFSGLKVIG